jgi:hypothetical protein
MAAVSETIVREYFELHGFFVRQQRKYVTPARHEDDEIDFLVINPQPDRSTSTLSFVLTSKDLPAIARAVVVVKGWHTETFGPAMVTHAPEIFRFAESVAFRQASLTFGQGPPPAKILVVPALAQSKQTQEQVAQLFRSKGIDAVIPFRTVLADLIESIEVNRNYQKSDLLQTIRILKNYDFLKGPQLELFRPKRRKAGSGK